MNIYKKLWAVIKKVSIGNKIWTVIKKGWVIVVIIVTVFAFIALKDQIHRLFTPQQKLYEEETFLRGILISNFTENDKNIKIFFGTNLSIESIEKFKQGFNISIDPFTSPDDSGWIFRSKVSHYSGQTEPPRIYVSKALFNATCN